MLLPFELACCSYFRNDLGGIKHSVLVACCSNSKFGVAFHFPLFDGSLELILCIQFMSSFKSSFVNSYKLYVHDVTLLHGKFN